MMDLKQQMKSEYRNPKQIQMTESPRLLHGCDLKHSGLRISDLFRISDIRISDLTGADCNLIGLNSALLT